MGRKARLKKVRRETTSSVSAPQPQLDSDPTEFVQQLQQKGYEMQQIVRSPQIPDQRVNPQL